MQNTREIHAGISYIAEQCFATISYVWFIFNRILTLRTSKQTMRKDYFLPLYVCVYNKLVYCEVDIFACDICA